MPGSPLVVRSAAAENGAPPGAVYADMLAAYSDDELVAYGDRILAWLREGTANSRIGGGQCKRW